MLRVHILFFHLCRLSLIPCNAQPAFCDSISWSDSTRLTWANFKGVPDTTSNIGALSFISLSYTLENFRNEHQFTVRIYFEPCKSWFKTTDSTLSLQHEQTHFDIDEFIRRKFIDEVLKIENFSRYASPSVREIYLNILTTRNFMHHRYDAETDYHRNNEQENNWINNITRMIKELENFRTSYYLIRSNKAILQ